MNPPNIRIASLSLIVSAVIFVGVATLPSGAGDWMGLNTSSAQMLSWQDKVEPSVLTAAATGETQFLIYMNSQADLSGASCARDEGRKGRICLRTPDGDSNGYTAGAATNAGSIGSHA